MKEILTDKFLVLCYEAGYSAVEITAGEVIGYINTNYDKFNNDENSNRCLINNWPATWNIVKELKINYGCGNGHQHQIAYNSLDCGLYTFLRWEE